MKETVKYLAYSIQSTVEMVLNLPTPVRPRTVPDGAAR